MAVEFNPSIRIVNNLLLGLATLAKEANNSQNKTIHYILRAKIQHGTPLLWTESLQNPLTEQETEQSLDIVRKVLDLNIKTISNFKLSPVLRDALNKTINIFSNTQITSGQRRVLTDMIEEVGSGVKPGNFEKESQSILKKPIEGIFDFETLVEGEEAADENSFLTLSLDNPDVKNFLAAPVTRFPKPNAPKPNAPKPKAPEKQIAEKKPFVVPKHVFNFYPEQIPLLEQYVPGNIFTKALAKSNQSGQGIKVKLTSEEFALCNQILSSLDTNYNTTLVNQGLTKGDIAYLIETCRDPQTAEPVKQLLEETLTRAQENLAANFADASENAVFGIVLSIQQSAACLQLLEDRVVQHPFSQKQLDLLIQKTQGTGSTKYPLLEDLFAQVKKNLAAIKPAIKPGMKTPKKKARYNITLTQRQLNASLMLLQESKVY